MQEHNRLLLIPAAVKDVADNGFFWHTAGVRVAGTDVPVEIMVAAFDGLFCDGMHHPAGAGVGTAGKAHQAGTVSQNAFQIIALRPEVFPEGLGRTIDFLIVMRHGVVADRVSLVAHPQEESGIGPAADKEGRFRAILV